MIYICIPAHNEERTIGVVLWKIRQVMAAFPRDYQILVANDGSSDKTADVLAPYQRVLPLSVLHLDRRHGYACALELLLREASKRAEYPKRDVIVTLQADFSEDPEHLTAMLKRIEAGADVVCTNAALPEKATRAARWSRRIGAALLRRRRWPEGISDPLSGFRAYRVHTVRKAIELRGTGRLLTWDGRAANVELLTQVLPHARRAEAFDTSIRSDRQQRTSRQTFWTFVGPLLRLATGGAGPLQGQAPESTAWSVAASEIRKPAQPTRRPPSERVREPRGNGEGEPRRRQRPSNGRPKSEGARADSPKAEGEERQGRRGPPRKRVRPQPAQNGNESPKLEVVQPAEPNGEAPRKKRRRRRRRAGPRPELNGATPSEGSAEETVEQPILEAGEGDATPAPTEERKRRRNRRGRGRRGRRGGSNTGAPNGVSTNEGGESPAGETSTPPPEPTQPYLETGTD